VALIDAGPTKDIVALLKRDGVEDIDLVVASHHHADHIGGMAAVIREFPPKVYLESGSAHTSTTYKRLLDAVKKSEATAMFPRAKERKIALGKVTLRVFPQPPEDEDNENNNSVGLRLEYKQFSVLLTGDSEEDEREWWLKEAAPELLNNVTILKASHHGSRNGVNKKWLQATSPKLAIISCGKDNPYGHPHEETLNLLNRLKINLCRIDEAGTVTIRSNGKDWNIVVPENSGRKIPAKNLALRRAG
jgi:beta-lactamase superfamily II metal-dependent hydrolase